MEHDRPRLKQDKSAFFIGRNLPERMKRSMRGFLHCTERNKTNLVRLAHFLKRPTNAHVTRQSLAAIGRPFKGGNRRGHGRLRMVAWRYRASLSRLRETTSRGTPVRSFLSHLSAPERGPRPHREGASGD